MRHKGLWICLALLCPTVLAAAGPGDEGKADSVARGRYLIAVAGCNDCHTDGFIQTNGQVPEEKWLMGSGLGWRGPWGTTYAPNLRLTMSFFSEDEWVETAREVEYRPPMPWFNLRFMTEEDLRAVYRFIRTLEPVGEPAPAYLPPDDEPPPPFVLFPSPPKE